MKIKKLHIKNFKSIADLEIIEPNPFTVFVGPNGSGKSNIFEALEYAQIMTLGSGSGVQPGKDEKLFGDNGDFIAHNDDNNSPILVEFNFDYFGLGFLRMKNSPEISNLLSSLVTKQLLHQVFQQILKEKKIELSIEDFDKKLDNVTFNKLLGVDSEFIYRFLFLNEELNQLPYSMEDLSQEALSKLFANQISHIESKEFTQYVHNFSRIFLRHLNRTSYKKSLRSDASNLETILKKILLNNSKKEELIDWLRLFIPEFENIEIQKDLRGRNELRVFEKNSLNSMNKILISDGTYNILALLTAVFQSDEPQFLCIEEPENGLTPDVIKEMVNFFRNACEEKGHYIWLNTHSQSLVSQLSPDEIITVNKIKGETKIKQFKGEDFNGLSMDEAWLTNTLGGGLPW